MAFGNMTFEDQQDDADQCTVIPTMAGLEWTIPCERCGHHQNLVESWRGQHPSDSSVAGAFSKPPQRLRDVLNHAIAKLPAGQGFSFVVLKERDDGSNGELVFAMFTKCPSCQGVSVGVEKISTIKALIPSR